MRENLKDEKLKEKLTSKQKLTFYILKKKLSFEFLFSSTLNKLQNKTNNTMTLKIHSNWFWYKNTLTCFLNYLFYNFLHDRNRLQKREN